jgi:hypothetical protein
VSSGIEIARVIGGPSMSDLGIVTPERTAGVPANRRAAAQEAGTTRPIKSATQGGKRTRISEPQAREKILEVAAEGGSLSILRARARDGAWRFIVLREETALADLLDSDDQEGLVFSEESGSVDTLAAAFQLMDRYPWHRLMPLTLQPEYAAVVMAEVLRRGGAAEAARWQSELSRRSDRLGP